MIVRRFLITLTACCSFWTDDSGLDDKVQASVRTILANPSNDDVSPYKKSIKIRITKTRKLTTTVNLDHSVLRHFDWNFARSLTVDKFSTTRRIREAAEIHNVVFVHKDIRARNGRKKKRTEKNVYIRSLLKFNRFRSFCTDVAPSRQVAADRTSSRVL